MATLIDDHVSTVRPQNGSDFTLEELRTLLQCDLVQAVPIPDGKYIWVDEEGKLKPHTANTLATFLYGHFLAPDDYLAGIVLVTEEGEVI